MKSHYPRSAGAPRRTKLVVRHFCAECGGRVFPFDKYEDFTESPEPGRQGGTILLRSQNAQDPENRHAWCWSCDALVHAERLTEREFLQMYLKRKGVNVRPSKPKKQRKVKQ